MIGILSSKSERAETGSDPIKEHLLVTRYLPERVKTGDMLGVNDILEILSINLLGVIPESRAVLKASNMGIPVTHNKQSDAGQAYMDAVDRLLGETIKPMRFVESKKKGLLASLYETIAGE